MQPAGAGGVESVAAAMASFKRQRDAAATAEAEKRRFKVDFDILECPICSEQFSPPVYQCENGHTACASCCKKFTKGCPSCSHPIGRIRNLAIEKMIESLESDCKYVSFGCKETLTLSQREEHENGLCEHRIIQCPVPGHHHFQAAKSSISMHLMTEHGAKIQEFSEDTRSASFKMKPPDEYVMLKSKDKWLLLHWWTEKPSGAARIYCIGFGGPEKVRLWTKQVPYKLTVEPIKKNGLRVVVYNMQAVASDYSWVSDWNYDYLVIPRLRTDTSKRELNVTVSLE